MKAHPEYARYREQVPMLIPGMNKRLECQLEAGVTDASETRSYRLLDGGEFTGKEQCIQIWNHLLMRKKSPFYWPNRAAM